MHEWVSLAHRDRPDVKIMCLSCQQVRTLQVCKGFIVMPSAKSESSKIRLSPLNDLFIYLWTLYIKEKEVNTATRTTEKNYFRVDKKTTS
jgi:hypothetical protein